MNVKIPMTNWLLPCTKCTELWSNQNVAFDLKTTDTLIIVCWLATQSGKDIKTTRSKGLISRNVYQKKGLKFGLLCCCLVLWFSLFSSRPSIHRPAWMFFWPIIVLLGCLFPITLLVGLGWWFGRLRKDKPIFWLEKIMGIKKHSEKTSRSDSINN